MSNHFWRLAGRSFLLLLVATIVFSCRSKVRHIAQELESFQRVAISIPEDMLRIPREDEIEVFSVEEIKPKFIMYIDSTECSSCLVANLSSLRLLDTLSNYGERFSTFIILSPSGSKRKALIDELELFPPARTVYLDINGSFADMNREIPSNPLYHSFLLNQDNHPIFVGNPLAGNDIKEAFISALSNMDN